MKKHKFLFPISLGLLMTGMLHSCKKTDDLKANVKVFKTDIFKEQLQAQLSTARGYQFVITQNGMVADTAAFGIGSTDRASNTPASVNAYVNVASVTKTFTAVAAIRLIKLNNLTIDSAIGKWLPDSWTKNAAISNLKFRDLLTHTSGIRTGTTDWASLKNVVANPPESTTDYAYANANFALFRAMIPKLDNPLTFKYWEDKMTTEDFEQWMSNLYIDRVNVFVFSNAGIPERGCNVPAGDNVHVMMNEAPFNLTGKSAGDWTNLCGGGGFYLTAMDMSRFIVYLTHSNDILSDEQRTLMDDNRLGWNRAVSVTGGTALGHGGGLYSDTNGDGSYTPGDCGLQTLIMKFPNEVELALAINSIGNDWRDTNSIVQTAYNAAWVFE